MAAGLSPYGLHPVGMVSFAVAWFCWYATGHDNRIPFAGKLRLIGGERHADVDGISCLGPLAAWGSDMIAIID